MVVPIAKFRDVLIQVAKCDLVVLADDAAFQQTQKPSIVLV